MPDASSDLDALVQAVRAGAKYKSVSEDLVRHVGARELATRRRLKEAVKATKKKLHQVGGAYLERRIDYERELAALGEAQEAGDGPFRRACREAMERHASTRERLPILDTFYETALENVRPVRSVLDVACGLNPLAVPWMGLATGATYHAYDVYADLVALVDGFLPLAGVRGGGEARDVTRTPPTRRAELGLLLKTLPCLEQLEKGAGLRLLEALQVDHALVSFPACSLGGARKGMVENYGAQFAAMVRDKPWTVRRFEFDGELAFLVHKRKKKTTETRRAQS